MKFHRKSVTYQAETVPSTLRIHLSSNYQIRDSVRFLSAHRRISDPPDESSVLPPGQEKTAGRADTLHSGSFDSLAATSPRYDIIDSRASAKFAGGDV
jgi:hypothetical protein